VQVNSGERLSLIRPHKIGERVGDPMALNVERESKCCHFKDLLLQTRVELRSRCRCQ
jgi:hypothetical protein